MTYKNLHTNIYKINIQYIKIEFLYIKIYNQ